MPFDRPPLEELRERIKLDLANKLTGANPWLRVSNLRVFAEVEAGASHLLHGRLEWNYRQLFPDLADTDSLIRWASIWGIKKSPATRATGPCQAIAVMGSAASVMVGDMLQLEGNPPPNEEPPQFRVTMTAIEVAGLISFQIEAVAYGLEGNLPAGTLLRFLTTRPDVAPIAEVSPPGLAGGAPEDTDEELLAALLKRIQMPPHGGCANDYIVWTLEVSGVTRAWVYPLERGFGTVVVRFMMDDVQSANQGIPTNAQCRVVYDYLFIERPVTADIGPDRTLDLPPPNPPGIAWGWGYIFPPWPFAQAVTIAGLQPDTPEVRAAIEIELRDMIRHETSPGETLYQSDYVLAIGNAPGVDRFRLIDPGADVVVRPGEIVVLGPITYVP